MLQHGIKIIITIGSHINYRTMPLQNAVYGVPFLVASLLLATYTLVLPGSD